MTRIKLILFALVVASLSLVFVACGDDEEDTGGGGEDVAGASFELTVGALVPLTGDLSQFGPPRREGRRARGR